MIRLHFKWVAIFLGVKKKSPSQGSDILGQIFFKLILVTLHIIAQVCLLMLLFFLLHYQESMLRHLLHCWPLSIFSDPWSHCAYHNILNSSKFYVPSIWVKTKPFLE